MSHPEHPEWGTLTVGEPVGKSSHWITFHDGETMLLRNATLEKHWQDTGV
jgi:hypothetical protein